MPESGEWKHEDCVGIRRTSTQFCDRRLSESRAPLKEKEVDELWRMNSYFVRWTQRVSPQFRSYFVISMLPRYQLGQVTHIGGHNLRILQYTLHRSFSIGKSSAKWPKIIGSVQIDSPVGRRGISLWTLANTINFYVSESVAGEFPKFVFQLSSFDAIFRLHFLVGCIVATLSQPVSKHASPKNPQSKKELVQITRIPRFFEEEICFVSYATTFTIELSRYTITHC